MTGERSSTRGSLSLHRQHAWLALRVLLAIVALAGASGSVAGAPEGEAAVPSALAAKSLLLDASRAGARIVAVGAYGHVLLSDDDGVEWRQAANVPTRTTLTGVQFVDARRGWAVGHDATVLATEDGGEHWALQHSDPGAEGPLFSIWLDGSGRGIAVGAYGQALVTEDGGASWVESRVGSRDEDWHLNELFEGADGALYVAAEMGRVHRSTDGGRSWDARSSDYEGSFWGGIGLSGGRLLVFGMRGNVWSSDDGGASWRALPRVSRPSLSAAAELANGDVVMVGLGGSVLISTDGGAHFVATTHPERKGANAVLTLAGDPGGVLLFGEGGVQRLSAADLRALVAAQR